MSNHRGVLRLKSMLLTHFFPTSRTHLGLSDGLLDVIVGELISNGVPDANTVPLKEEVVVDDRLDVAIEIPGHLVVKLHGNDVH